MKATFPLPTFRAAFRDAARFASDRNIKPILLSALLTVDKDGLWELKATNLEMSLHLEGGVAEVSKPGACLLPAESLASALQLVDGEVVEVAVDKVITVKCGKTEFSFASQDAKGFPAVASFDDEDWYEVKASDLAALLRRTAFAVSDTDRITPENRIQYATTGALIACDEREGVRVVATDCRIMGTGRGPAAMHGKVAETKTAHIMPYLFMMALEKVLRAYDGEAPVRISLRNRDAIFQVGHADIQTVLLGGRYPPWRVLLGEERPTKISMPFGTLRDAIRKCLLVADEFSSRLSLGFEKDKLVVSAQTATSSSSSEIAVACDREIELFLSLPLIKPLLKVIDPGAVVSVEIEDASKTVLIRDGEFCYAISPMS